MLILTLTENSAVTRIKRLNHRTIALTVLKAGVLVKTLILKKLLTVRHYNLLTVKEKEA